MCGITGFIDLTHGSSTEWIETRLEGMTIRLRTAGRMTLAHGSIPPAGYSHASGVEGKFGCQRLVFIKVDHPAFFDNALSSSGR